MTVVARRQEVYTVRFEIGVTSQPAAICRIMRFTLLDRIVCLEPGQRITAVKSLSAGGRISGRPFSDVSRHAGRADAGSDDPGRSLAGPGRARILPMAWSCLKEARNVKYSQFRLPRPNADGDGRNHQPGRGKRSSRPKAPSDGEARLALGWCWSGSIWRHEAGLAGGRHIHETGAAEAFCLALCGRRESGEIAANRISSTW